MWEIIISSIVSLLAGGGIMQFINWKAAKKKANLDNDSIAVENLNKVIETLERSNSHFETVNKQREDTICKLRDELTECEGDLNVACSYICKKANCSFRVPNRGFGSRWLQDLKEGKELPDYSPLNKDTICCNGKEE